MKSLRILLTLLIAVSVFMSVRVAPATAAQEEEVGYIRLLSEKSLSSEFNQGMDAKMARTIIAARARESFERIMPKMLDAQRSGLILDFKPELDFGMVRIKYATGVNLSAVLPGFQVFSKAKEAILMVPVQQYQDVSAALTYYPNFFNSIYGSCYDVYGLLDNYRAVAILKNQAGKTLAISQAIADSNGHAWDCFDSWTTADVKPGLKIIYKIYRPDGSLRSTFSRLVPGGIAITAINKVESKVSFKGPAGKSYNVIWYHPNLNSTNTYILNILPGTFPTTGTATRDMGTVRFRGGDYLGVEVKLSRFTFSRAMWVPSIRCDINDDYCFLDGFAFKSTTITVVQNGITYKKTGRSDAWGSFYAYFTDASGLPMTFKPGDKVSGTGVPTWTLPTLTANIVYTTDVVRGKAPKSRFFELWVYSMVTSSWYYKWTGSNTLGNYQKDFTSMIDLKIDEPYYVEIWYIDKATGNTTDAYFPFAP